MSEEAARIAWQRYARWMREEALPFWSDKGLSAEGGAVERMSLAGEPQRAGFKRVRVHARQLYVFSHAHCLGLPGLLEPAAAVARFLLAHGAHPEGGWVVSMGETGGIVDAERDLYDQAFVVLALSWWAKASGREEPVALARATLGLIADRFARADGRGFLARLPDRGDALQNPHMHLLEAALALDAIAPDALSRSFCTRLRALFDACLFDAATGTLGECFTADWSPAPGEDGARIEPGHHYEWVWLLEMAERQGYPAAQPAAQALFDFAERHGLAPDGDGRPLIHDALDREGRPLSAAHRSWPQTERLKALAVRAERSGMVDHAALAGALDALWTHYLAPAPAGCWIDHVRADLTPCAAAVPASTLYHLFLAYAELERCAPLLFGTGASEAEGS